MKTIVAGSRSLNEYKMTEEAIDDVLLMGFEITEIVSGGARGPDTFGEHYAKKNNIPIKIFPADWDKHGRAAGIIRNGEMADYADALIAIYDGTSRGTIDMINKARHKGLLVFRASPGKPVKQFFD